jgi:glutamate-5-semialdehyde dehydrogenase
MSVMEICRCAANATAAVRQLSTKVKNQVLGEMADEIDARRDLLRKINAEDVELARQAGISGTLLDRLTLTDSRITTMVNAVRTIAALPDPVGEVVRGWTRPNGLLIERVREPLGVVAVIYEARPNVTSDVAALCLKSGNCAILRGSSMAVQTNVAIMETIGAVIARHESVPDCAIQLIDDPSREAALQLMQATDHVDLLVPRGGPALIKTIQENATVPTVIDGDGNCHLYIDASAQQQMATDITINAKTSRPSVCNAIETLLVHEQLATSWLPQVLDTLHEMGVEIRGSQEVIKVWPKAIPATESDWSTEYLDLVLAVDLVPDVDEAIAHVNRWGTSNAEGIVAQDIGVARKFAQAVDSGSVFVNTSTRFSDGGEFGYGVEIGVSTQKLHVRGPMGLEALTTVKNVVSGTGQVRII